MIVADSDVLIDALHGVEPLRTRIGEAITAGGLGATAITVFELCTGARNELEQGALDALLGALPVLPLDDAVARVAAAVERDLRRKGTRIGFADALVAGTCLVTGASLLTRNTKHFGRVPGLRLAPIGG